MFLTLNDKQLSSIKRSAVHSAHFRFLNVSLTFSSDSIEAVDIFSAMYQNFMASAQPVSDIMCYIIKDTDTGSKPAAVVNGRAYELFEDELFISHAHMIVFQHVLDTIDDHLLIHAGVVAKEGRGIIISGPSTYGKTTMMLELVSRGFKFYSDEFCAVNLSDSTITAFPRSIGLRESNPFLNRTDKSKCLLLKNIGRGKKYLVNCDNLFPNSRGSICKAHYLILLKNKQTTENMNNKTTIDLALYNDNQTLADEICSHDGIDHVGTYMESDYVVYRFSIPLQTGLTKAFRDICNRYTDQIFYQERVTQEDPDFISEPFLKPIAKSAASLEILKNLRNRSIHSKLLNKFNHKSSQLLLTIGDFLNGVECYEMTTGPLNKMAAMIESLYQKG
jgi:hypothetical protein